MSTHSLAQLLWDRSNRLNTSIRRIITCAGVVRDHAFPHHEDGSLNLTTGRPKSFRVPDRVFEDLQEALAEYEEAARAVLGG